MGTRESMFIIVWFTWHVMNIGVYILYINCWMIGLKYYKMEQTRKVGASSGLSSHNESPDY